MTCHRISGLPTIGATSSESSGRVRSLNLRSAPSAARPRHRDRKAIEPGSPRHHRGLDPWDSRAPLAGYQDGGASDASPAHNGHRPEHGPEFGQSALISIPRTDID